MVFYEQLPTELWFIIYKIEHQNNLAHVNKDIIYLKNDTMGWSWLRLVDPIYKRRLGSVYNIPTCNWENGSIEDIKYLENYWNTNSFLNS